jgi:hypothetical protein
LPLQQQSNTERLGQSRSGMARDSSSQPKKASRMYPVPSRVARGHFFKPKILIWVNLGRPCNGSCLYILWTFGLFYGHLVYFVVIWYIFPPCW